MNQGFSDSPQGQLGAKSAYRPMGTFIRISGRNSAIFTGTYCGSKLAVSRLRNPEMQIGNSAKEEVAP